MTELLNPDHFLPHVGKVFRVSDGRHAFALMRVDQRKLAEGEVVPRQPFVLIFRGPPGDVLPEGLYTFEVEDGRAFELYVQPVFTPQRDRQDYQSSFN
jgi:hypothetical protein